MVTEHIEKRRSHINRLVTVDVRQEHASAIQELVVPMISINSLSDPRDESSLLMVSRTGELFASSVPQEKPATLASKIQVPTTKQSKLFDDIFGTASMATFSSLPSVSKSKKASKSSALDILNPAAHLLPSVSLLWKNLLPLPAKLPAPPKVDEEMEEANVDEDVDAVASKSTVEPIKFALHATPRGLIASSLKLQQ